MSFNESRTGKRVDCLWKMLNRFAGVAPEKRALARRKLERACHIPERLEERLNFSPLITLGTYNLLPNTANQKINVYIGGNDGGIQGVDFAIMTGDAGPQLGGSIAAPAITNVDLLATGVSAPNNLGTPVSTNTLFSGDNNGTAGAGEFAGGQVYEVSTLTNPAIGNGSVFLSGSTMDPVSGRTGQALLAVITVDTTGFSANTSFNISVDGSVNNGPVIADVTDFPPEAIGEVSHFAGYTDGTLTIGNAIASRTTLGGVTANYGDASATLTANVSVPGAAVATPATEGIVTFSVYNAANQQVGSSVQGTVSALGVATAPFSLTGVNAGAYTLRATYADAGNVYSANSSSPATLTINKATLNVTATANSKTYGQTASDAGTVTGQQNGDNITGTFSSTGDVATAGVATYAITDTLNDHSTGTLANYNINFTGANLVVGKATLTVTANANTKAVGDTATDSGTVMGIQNSDPITAVFSSAGDPPGAVAGMYPITAVLSDAGTGALANYTENFTGAMLNVTPSLTTVSTPQFDMPTGTYTSSTTVNITDATTGSTIHYTLDGSTPTTSSPTYSTTLTISTTETLKAFAVKSGLINSALATATYTIQAATPIISPAAGTYTSSVSVMITDATPSTIIRYTTDGSTPTASSTQYSTAFTVSTSETITAAAFKTGVTTSASAASAYTIVAATPVILPAPGQFTTSVSVSMTDATPGTVIRYTTDGSTPTASSLQYSNAFTVSASETITAAAFKTGVTTSANATSAYTIIAATPVILPAAGQYTTSVSVSMTDATPGTVIRYTTDGSTPTASSLQYSNAFSVSTSETITAAAFASGVTTSANATSAYTIIAATPMISPAAGQYTDSVSVTITDATPGAAIRYTTDGSTPNGSSALYGTGITVNTSETITAAAFGTGITTSPSASSAYSVIVSTPVISPPAGNYGTAQLVSITDANSNATITYTTDGSTPTASSTAYNNTPFTVSSSETVKAVAFFTGATNSLTASNAYTIGVAAAATPMISLASGSYIGSQSVMITDATSGATIHYTTDGSTPMSTSPTYTTTLTISASETLNAIAIKSGLANSPIASATYTIVAATPIITPAAGSYTTSVSVMMTDATAGTTIHYTTDGSTPTIASPTYSTAITVSTSETITAAAFKSGLTTSANAANAYTINAATPIISPAAGTYISSTSVMITDATPGVTIRYTTDGSTPTATSPIYSNSFSVAVSETITAAAFANGVTTSATASNAYVIMAATPVISPAAGTYVGSVSVTINAATMGSAIFYTTDGSTPTVMSNLYSGMFMVSASETIKAVAFVTGQANSATASNAYTIAAATPIITPAGGTYTSAQTVMMTDATPGATIHYTTDGSTPTASSPTYGTSFLVSTSETIKAAAFASGLATSAIASNAYTINVGGTVATPVLSKAAGNYIDSITVTISDSTSGATIHYTTNGTTPTASSPVYSTGLTFTTTTNLKAIAIKAGMTDSAVAASAYTIVPSTSIVTLTSGTAVSNLSGTTGNMKFFKLVIPAGKTKLVLTTTGGTGNANLYLRNGGLPANSVYDQRSINSDDNETITLNNPAAGTYYFMIYGQAAYTGVTIKAVLS